MIRCAFYAFIIVIYLSPLHIHADISFTKQNVPTVTPNTNHLNSTPQHEDISRKAAKAMAEAESAVRELKTVIYETQLAKEAAKTANTQQETAHNTLIKTESDMKIGHTLEAKAEAHKAVEAANAAKTAVSMAEESVNKVKMAVENVQRHQKAAEKAVNEAREATKKVKEAEKRAKEETKKNAAKEKVTPAQPEKQKEVAPIEKTVANVPLNPKKEVKESLEVESSDESQEKGKKGDGVEKNSSSETVTTVVPVVPPETVENSTSDKKNVETPQTTDSDVNTKTPLVDSTEKDLGNQTQQESGTNPKTETDNELGTKDTQRIDPSQAEEKDSEKAIQKPEGVPPLTTNNNKSSTKGDTDGVLSKKEDKGSVTSVETPPQKQVVEEAEGEDTHTQILPSTPDDSGKNEKGDLLKGSEEKAKMENKGTEAVILGQDPNKKISNPEGTPVRKPEGYVKEGQTGEDGAQQGVTSDDDRKKDQIIETPLISGSIDGGKSIVDPNLASGDLQSKESKTVETEKEEKDNVKKDSNLKIESEGSTGSTQGEGTKNAGLSSHSTQEGNSGQQKPTEKVLNVQNGHGNTLKPGNSETQDVIHKSVQQQQQQIPVTPEGKTSKDNEGGDVQNQPKLFELSPDSSTQETQVKVALQSTSTTTGVVQEESKDKEDEDEDSPKGGTTSDKTTITTGEAQGSATEQTSDDGDEGEAKVKETTQINGGTVTTETKKTEKITEDNVQTTADVETTDGFIAASVFLHEPLTRMKPHTSALSTSFASQTELQSTTIISKYDLIEEKLTEAIKKANKALDNSEKLLHEALSSLLSANKSAGAADELAKKAEKAVESVNEKDFVSANTNTVAVILCSVILLLTMTTT